MPPEELRRRLTSLLSDEQNWVVFTELAALDESARAPILRPHDEVRLHAQNEGAAILTRRRLDKALGRLTLLEIAFETSLFDQDLARDPAWSRPNTGLADFRLLVSTSESFFGYASAYLYFGTRILAYRCYGPCYPRRTAAHDAAPAPTPTGLWARVKAWFTGPFKKPHHISLEANDSENNRRPFPIAVPPRLDMFAEEPQRAAEIFGDFVDISDLLKDEWNAKWRTALSFLDGFQPGGYGQPIEGGENAGLPLPAIFKESFQQPFQESFQEPARYELWLRGLLPDAPEVTQQRFAEISLGLTAWALERARFYAALEPLSFKADGVQLIKPAAQPEQGVLKNPLTARFALADIYWLARLLRAEISSDATVQSSRLSWLDLLRFKASLDQNEVLTKSLKDCEYLLRLVFSYVCDLAQNGVALAAQREIRHFTPEQSSATNGAGEERQTKGWRAVFDEELREIDRERSRRTYGNTSFPPKEPFAWNATLDDLYWSEVLLTGRQPHNRIGLAFSGGGVRSATFNLGVLEGLQDLNMLRFVDYLSTVSGGGFIGSWLVGNVKRTRQWLMKGVRWDESIAYLRSYSSYLAPLTGILRADTWTLGASWARNTFLIQLTGLVWLVALLLLALAMRMLFWFLSAAYPAGHLSVPFPRSLCPQGLHLPYTGLLALLMGGVCAVNLARNFKQDRVETGTNAPRSWKVLWFLVLPCWVGAFCVAAMLASDARHWVESPPQQLAITSPLGSCKTLLCSELSGVAPAPPTRDFSFLFKRSWEWLDTLLLAHFVALMIIGRYALIPSKATPHRGIWTVWRCLWIGTLCSLMLYLGLCGVLYLNVQWARPAARFESLDFVFGPALVLVVFTLSVVLFIGFSGRASSEAQREWWTRFGAWIVIFAVIGLLVSAAAVLGPALVFSLLALTAKWKSIRWGATLGSLGTVISGILAGRSSRTAGNGQSNTLDLVAKAGGAVFVVVATLATSTVLYLLLLNITSNRSSSDPYWEALASIHGLGFWAVFGVVLACGGLFSWFFEINIFGLSQLYRNRLVRCYLGATRWAPGARNPHPFTKFDFHDDMELSDLSGGDFRGPFPILNCTLNLGGSSDLTVHSRHSASFSMTPLRCGADRPKVGYAPTRGTRPGQRFADGVKLGQAVAISGAAASPNMGYNTSPLVALLLTMFNVRLGWWFPNPGRNLWTARGLRFSLWYLAQELLGTADENSRFLNVSDGGHFENLGIYELIRRRAKVIIACDAECDELLQFGSLGNLVRICATDFGAVIDLDVRSIARQREGSSITHSAVGKIRYSNGSTGYLIYLKASITGDEDIAVTQYRSEHPSFPHETTANQFYTEAQFDSYRMLGRHIVEHAFRGISPGEHPVSAAERLADVMAPARSSGEAYLKHTRTLSNLWKQFRTSPSLHSFLDELMWIHPPMHVVPPSGTPHQETEELCAALELIQLMEDVFMDLQLEDFWEHPDNRGWAILFMRWARSPRFREYWSQTHRTIGIRFEYFCAARLGLKRDVPMVRV